MAETKELSVPDALYDYVLYYECARSDWADYSQKRQIKGDGSLVNAIDWTCSSTTVDGDSGGATKCGVTHFTWKNYVKNHPNEGYNEAINNMTQQGWFGVIADFWKKSGAAYSANYACAFTLFQMRWGGFTQKRQEMLLSTLKENATIKDYNFISSGTYYRKIADATHAYTDPMVAYDYIRRAKSTYMWDISTPDRTNSQFRVGWMTRNVVCFTPYGLYVNTGFTPKGEGLKYEHTVQDWENYVVKWIQENKPGYVKIFDWGASPESVASRLQNSTFYTPSDGSFSGTFSGSAGGTYGGMLGGVYKLGDYSKNQDMKVEPQQNQKREEVFKTLKGNSYLPDQIIECSEFITDDKKKGVKTKSKD